MKKNNYRYWITARKVLQYVILLTFIILFVITPSNLLESRFLNIGIRLDPLIALAQSISSRKIVTGGIIGLVVLISTFIIGRAWCGWICPLGTLLDIFPSRKHTKGKSGQPNEPPNQIRIIKYLLLFTLLSAAIWSNLTLLIFDPLTILFRSLTISIWPPLDQIVRIAEKWLYRLPFLANPISEFDSFVRPYILPDNPFFTRGGLLFISVFAGVIALNLAAPRFWCRYICPLGGLLGLIGKVAFLRREVKEDCKGCKICIDKCPTGTIDPEKGFTSDPSECTLCLECLNACPRSSIALQVNLRPGKFNPEYSPDRRHVIASFLTATTAVAIFHSDWTKIHSETFLIRPPGSEEDIFMSRCVRCGECMRACPTSALQPSMLEAGIEGLWTPIIVPRLGYCNYSCNACGQVCPSQAIPSLSIEDKRQQEIGKAYIDTLRCIAWADHQDCIVCEEMCPLPEKAIYLEEAQVIAESNTVKNVKLPHVERTRCIGCGICEFKCPLEGEAAIRVRIAA